MMNDTASRQTVAMELAKELSKQHNGIFTVELHLGHDGHNVCVLRNYEAEVGRGESGRDLMDAVEKAASNWRLRRYRGVDVTSSHPSVEGDILREALEAAHSAFKGPNAEASDGIFTTVHFEVAFNAARGGAKPLPLRQEDIVELLCSLPNVVRLHGGSHWMLLPGQHRRYVEGE